MSQASPKTSLKTALDTLTEVRKINLEASALIDTLILNISECGQMDEQSMLQALGGLSRLIDLAATKATGLDLSGVQS
jgi:hypothetical protein